MSYLTTEEKLRLLSEAMNSLAKLYQDLAQAPALTYAPNFVHAPPRAFSELKKIPSFQTGSFPSRSSSGRNKGKKHPQARAINRRKDGENKKTILR